MYRSRVGRLEPADQAEERMAAEAADRAARFDMAARGMAAQTTERVSPSPQTIDWAAFRRLNEGRR